MKRTTFFLILTIIICFFADGQLNLPVRNIGGEDYYYRVVKKKETIYGISRELGISKEDIIKYNPSVGTKGLQKDQVLYFPVSDFSKSKNQNEEVVNYLTHKVKRGETLYSLAKIYSITVEQLVEANPEVRSGLKENYTLIIPNTIVENGEVAGMPYLVKAGDTLYRLSINFEVSLDDIFAANPGVSPDNFQEGIIILIPTTKKQPKEKIPETVFVSEKAEKEDSFESLSEEYGIPVSDLKDANPDMDELKKGKTVIIPIVQNVDSCTVNIDNSYDSIIAQASIENGINISILLPFESTNNNPGKRSQYYRDFYRGFLLGVYELANPAKKINICAYDINSGNINNVLSNQQVKNSTIIFAPAENELLSQILQFGKEHNINIVNSFVVNDDNYLDNNNLFVLSTPSSYMYSSVQDYIETTYDGYNVVLLNDSDSENKPLIDYLENLSLKTSTIDISTDDYICADKTLFIPTSSSKETLAKFRKFIASIESNPENNDKFNIFGYPEWSLYTEHQNFLRQYNVEVFSRYALDKDNDLSRSYRYWYGESPINSIPKMYAIGYDLSRFFINTIEEVNNDFNNSIKPFNGCEININLYRPSAWSGFVNTASFIYRYSKDDITYIMIK